MLADLEVIRKAVQSDRPAARKRARDKLALWKAAADLLSIRDMAAIQDLPADERQTWQSFWEQVDRLLAELAQPPK